jgi:hypothetical protein
MSAVSVFYAKGKVEGKVVFFNEEKKVKVNFAL